VGQHTQHHSCRAPEEIKNLTFIFPSTQHRHMRSVRAEWLEWWEGWPWRGGASPLRSAMGDVGCASGCPGWQIPKKTIHCDGIDVMNRPIYRPSSTAFVNRQIEHAWMHSVRRMTLAGQCVRCALQIYCQICMKRFARHEFKHAEND
jgi:hypothetical protein